MKQHKRPLSRKLFAYWGGFVGIMLVALWVMQTVFLNDFYKYTKVREIKAIASDIEHRLAQDDIGEYLISTATKTNVCILLSDAGGYVLYEVGVGCPIDTIQTHQLKSLIIQAMVNNGSNLAELSSMSTIRVNGYPLFQENQTRKVDGILYTKLIQTAYGNYAVVLNTAIVPVEATIATIRVQLLYLTVAMVVLTLALALVLSKSLASPIVKITNASKELAKGNYSIQFDEGAYLEIAELANSLNYAAKELGKVDALQREWIANISHDLRTPLTMISGYAEVIRDIPGENTKDNIQTVIDEANRLASLVNDVLDISKLQSGSIKLTMSTINLTSLLEDIVSRYQSLMAKDMYHIEFINRSQDIIFTEVDELKLTQVIYNLINNAITYTGENKLVQIVQHVENDQILVEVVDCGEGIPSNQLEHIWERYYKIDQNHKRAQIGSGLGLAIVKDILDHHQAEYGVRSVVGEGSVFWFALKIVSQQ